MKFIYATDLHGDVSKYENLYHFAREKKIKCIHIGADLLPKGNNILKVQKSFAKGYLKDWYVKCKEEDIHILGFFGNDDIYTRKKYVREYLKLLDEYTVRYKDFIFEKAYPYVNDYPFGLKTACKKDKSLYEYVPYISTPLEVGSNGFYKISNITKYFKNKGTLRDDLNDINLKKPNKTIFSFHMPPSELGLDKCYDKRTVGSESIYKWIYKEQPRVVLCGHIHESPEMTNIWKIQLGNSLVIQPGNKGFVYFDIGKNIKSEFIKFNN